VFTGTVNRFVADESYSSRSGSFVTDVYKPVFNLVRFTVEKKYRGDVDKEIEIISSFYFKEGEKYFVYAAPGNDGKIYQLDNGECGRPPILLTDAKDDTDYAEEVASGKMGTRISGSVFEDRYRLWESRQPVPLKNVEVTIKSKKHSFATKTDEKGKFVFKDIPPAEYRIAASTPKGLHERILNNSYYFPGRSKPNTVSVGESADWELTQLNSAEKPKYYYRHWDSYNFVFTSLSSIEGKVVGSDGKVAPQQYLWLLPIDGYGNLLFDSPVQQLWMDRLTGKFVFEDVPAGKYRIAINRYDCHADRNPQFGRSFFPGVRDETEADVITVGENDSLKLKDFRLLPQREERVFSGIVRTADKKPLANASVFIIKKNYSNPNECSFVNIETKTDQSGRFTLKGYEGYEYKIRAYMQPTEQGHSRLSSNTLELPVKDDVANIELLVDQSN